MGAALRTAQLKHIPQHRNAPALYRVSRQRMQRSAHAVRTGIIAVFYHGESAELHDILPVARCFVACQRSSSLFCIQPQRNRQRPRRKGIVHIVHPHGRDIRSKFAAVFIYDGKVRPIRACGNAFRVHISLCLDAEADTAKPRRHFRAA